MSARTTSTNDSPPTSRWRLWIDGCGGFLLLCGSRWSVGGLGQSDPADICVRADWPRRAGSIERTGGDYFWTPGHSGNEGKRELITGSRVLPIPGSAAMTMKQPSPLSTSATLTLRPPHRFADHVDGVVLVHETLLIGPQTDCHIRCDQGVDRVVLTHRQGQWLGKVGMASDFEELRPGTRINLDSLAMTLEAA